MPDFNVAAHGFKFSASTQADTKGMSLAALNLKRQRRAIPASTLPSTGLRSYLNQCNNAVNMRLLVTGLRITTDRNLSADPYGYSKNVEFPLIKTQLQAGNYVLLYLFGPNMHEPDHALAYNFSEAGGLSKLTVYHPKQSIQPVEFTFMDSLGRTIQPAAGSNIGVAYNQCLMSGILTPSGTDDLVYNGTVAATRFGSLRNSLNLPAPAVI